MKQAIEAKVIAVSTDSKEVIENFSKEDLELFGGHSANICYTEKDWDEIVQEDYKKTESRIQGNKENHHHSVFGHSYITLYFTGIPKILAMLINNEHEYNTSEKSARRTKMNPSERELFLYNKWREIFIKLIQERYPNEAFFTKNKIESLAKENARYMISVMTPTKMEYTTSFRQWNYLYHFAKNMAALETDHPLIQMVKPSLEEFADTLMATGIITSQIEDYHHRGFSLITSFNDYEEQWGRSYSTNYFVSFASVAQLHRHRTLDYNITYPEVQSFFVPPLIEQNEALKKEWLEDIASVGSLIPQGTLVHVNETGKYEDFIWKLEERLCSEAQLETSMRSYQTLLKYVEELRKKNTKGSQEILKHLEPYTQGARCLSGYVCNSPCKFHDGICMTRKI